MKSGIGFTDTPDRQFDGPDEYAQNRISSKLNEIVTDQWCNPMDYLEPLEGAPHQKFRIGPFRLGCRAARSDKILYVLTITKCGGDAYRGTTDRPRPSLATIHMH